MGVTLGIHSEARDSWERLAPVRPKHTARDEALKMPLNIPDRL